uniref:Uncharacterized protein n=1 Tax=Avena sativa TaxID=4498 RepID=A0ACD5UVZ3_AVESA
MLIIPSSWGSQRALHQHRTSIFLAPTLSHHQAGQSSKSVNMIIGNTDAGTSGSGLENVLHATVLGAGTVDLKFTSGKIVQLKNVQHVPSIKKNLVSGSRLLKDGFKLVFESNKVVLSKYGTFVGKGYECGGVFRFSLVDFCIDVVNHVCTTSNETNV